MLRFILFLIIIIAIVGGAYYYLGIKSVQDTSKRETLPVQQKPLNNIPPGAMMEDGTIGE